MVKPPTQSYSFSSQYASLEPSQWQQNILSNAAEGIRRVTLRQLIDSSQVNVESIVKFRMDGVPINKIVVVANVRSHFDKGVSGRMYNFDDGTAKFQGRLPDVSYNGFVYEPFAYARITGELEHYDGMKMFRIDNIQPVFDSHEIYYHILHSMVDTLTAERGPPPSESISFTEDDYSLLPSRLEELTIAGGSQHAGLHSPDQIMEADQDPVRLAAIQLEVIACLEDPQVQRGDDGVTVFITDIIERVKERIHDVTPSELWKAMELLIERDMVYSNVDSYFGWKPDKF